MPYDPARDCCKDCLHFVIAPESDDEYGQVGECHRMPPTYVTITETWEFAALTADNTCGEHEPISPEPYAKRH